MKIDKEFCMSSYLAFRYIYQDDVDFYEGMHHENIKPFTESEKYLVHSSDEIGLLIERQLTALRDRKMGVMLSGGMDSAIVASYVPGAEAYTFRFLGGNFQGEELARAEYYAKCYNLNLHYVDISWQTVENHIDAVMSRKCAPVHSIEPQILQAALQAKTDGVETLLIGESSDLVFGGMDGLLAKDWTFDEFVKRYTFLNPADVLQHPRSILSLYEKYRVGSSIDFMSFMDDVFSVESSSSYMNAFDVATMPYYDPYARLKMAGSLDLRRVRSGEPKYLIRELMSKRYPDIPVPNKNPMPRPVDIYFQDWQGPCRKEFKNGLDMSKFSGNQKWQLWCLERFLNIYDKD